MIKMIKILPRYYSWVFVFSFQFVLFSVFHLQDYQRVLAVDLLDLDDDAQVVHDHHLGRLHESPVDRAAGTSILFVFHPCEFIVASCPQYG